MSLNRMETIRLAALEIASRIHQGEAANDQRKHQTADEVIDDAARFEHYVNYGAP
jgi:hypothetical protein